MSKKFAFVFPGQGSQSVGMLAELAEQYNIVKKTFAQASAVLGYDLWELTQQGPKEQLDLTHQTQPALLAASVAIWRVWVEQHGPMPVMMAGHSLGEYSALVCADVLDFKAAVRLVAKRGEYMQAAVATGAGAMAAIVGLDNDNVAEICRMVGSDKVTPANYNSIGQVVISGATEAVNTAILAAKDAGAKIAKLLDVSVPSHSELMRPAAQHLTNDLQKLELRYPQIPVMNNVDVEAASIPEVIEHALVRQLYSPVRWVEIIQRMQQQGITTFVECGPGKVLSGLIKRIDKELITMPLSESAQVNECKEFLAS